MNEFQSLPLRTGTGPSALLPYYALPPPYRNVRVLASSGPLLSDSDPAHGPRTSSSHTDHPGPSAPSPVAKLPSSERKDAHGPYGTPSPRVPGGATRTEGDTLSNHAPPLLVLDGGSYPEYEGREEEHAHGATRIIHSAQGPASRVPGRRIAARPPKKDPHAHLAVIPGPWGGPGRRPRTSPRAPDLEDGIRNPRSETWSKLFSDPRGTGSTGPVSYGPFLRSGTNHSSPVSQDPNRASQIPNRTQQEDA